MWEPSALHGICAMIKSELIDTIKRLLNVEDDPIFLKKLTEKELETLVAYIRDRLDNPPKRKSK